jgi:hypothetical protein
MLVFGYLGVAFDVTKDVQISKSVPRREREREQVARTAFRASARATSISRVATVDGALSPCYLFYEALIHHEQNSSDRDNLFMRR